MNLLVQPIALAAQNAVPVLHAQRCAGQHVMLGDGKVDDLVGFKNGVKTGQLFSTRRQIHLAEEFGIGQDDLSSLGVCAA